MLRNLKAEMARKGIRAKAICQSLSISEKAMSNKITEITDFTRSEMYHIQNTFFSDFEMSYLFASDVNPLN